MSNLPDAVWVLLTGFAFMVWSMTMESAVLGPLDIPRSSRFLQHEQIIWLRYCEQLYLHFSHK